jgi:hypothetical protein
LTPLRAQAAKNAPMIGPISWPAAKSRWLACVSRLLKTSVAAAQGPLGSVSAMMIEPATALSEPGALPAASPREVRMPAALALWLVSTLRSGSVSFFCALCRLQPRNVISCWPKVMRETRVLEDSCMLPASLRSLSVTLEGSEPARFSAAIVLASFTKIACAGISIADRMLPPFADARMPALWRPIIWATRLTTL